MANIRIKIDFQSEDLGNPPVFWYELAPDPEKTIGDLKPILATFQNLGPNYRIQVYLNDGLLHDWNKLSIIRDNETIVVKSWYNESDYSSESDPNFEIKMEPNDESVFETTSSSTQSLPLLRQISPLIGLTRSYEREQSLSPPNLSALHLVVDTIDNSIDNTIDDTIDNTIDNTIDSSEEGNQMESHNPKEWHQNLVTSSPERTFSSGEVQKKSKRIKKRSKRFDGFYLF